MRISDWSSDVCSSDLKTKLGKSTIDKLLIGLFSDRTLSVVEGHTKLPLRAMLEDRAGLWAAKDGPPTAPKPLDTPSIALLPFANLGLALARAFLADGITDAHNTTPRPRPSTFLLPRHLHSL